MSKSLWKAGKPISATKEQVQAALQKWLEVELHRTNPRTCVEFQRELAKAPRQEVMGLLYDPLDECTEQVFRIINDPLEKTILDQLSRIKELEAEVAKK